jgi:hypothetical protein
VYRGLAMWCRVPVPDGRSRVYIARFVREGIERCATVGERLTVGDGHRSAKVVAIFPGTVFRIVLDQGAAASGAMENPILVKEATFVQLFTSPRYV